MSALALLWLLTLAAVLVGLGQIYLALVEFFPVRLVYWHSRTRKPAILLIVAVSLTTVLFKALSAEASAWMALPIVLQALMLVTTFRMHQENMFPADDFPACTDDLDSLPLQPDDDIALIEVGDELKAYPLRYVIHHHIVNDRIGNKLVSLTYCAMCRTVIAFDVTDLGPLYVASFKYANMVVADRKTHTFFQQATFKSIMGPLHPAELQPFPCQLLPWQEVLQLEPRPRTAVVTQRDLREFKLPLPIPGLWKKLMASDKTPGLFEASKDRRYPARTRVLGFVVDGKAYVVLKNEVAEKGILPLPEQHIVLVTTGESVNGFEDTIDGKPIELRQYADGNLEDKNSGTRWDPRGKYREGTIKSDLQYRAVSDEYWFSWMKWHPGAELVRLSPARES